MKFIEKWHDAVDDRNSVLCAGLDPADFEMGREDGLPEGTDKRDWALRYVKAVAPYCAALKPNIQYWKGKGNSDWIYEVCDLASDEGLVVIDDSKLADIGSTNEAGVFYAAQRADAVTIAPYAGNLKETVEQCKKHGIGAITMCLMSNPEFEAEKNMLVRIPDGEYDDYNTEDLIFLDGRGYAGVSSGHYVPRYISNAHNARKFGADGIVIGAPSKKNHIKPEEIERARSYTGNNMIVLLPGVGAQGGEASSIWKYFGTDDVIVNVGRALMKPENGNWEEAAKHYREMLNGLRAA